MTVSGLQSLYGNYYGTSRISSLRSTQMQKIQQLQQLREIMQERTSATSSTTRTRSMERSNSDFLKNYNKSMSQLMTSANSLRSMNSTSIWNKTTVKSSDKSVMSVTQNYRMSAKDSYAVNVTQLAKKQSNLSAGLQKNALAEKDAAFSITTKKGSFSFQINAKAEDGTFKTNGQMLREMADAVNAKGIGVKAAVSTEEDTSKITFTSEETGKENSFTIEGEAAAAYGFDQVQEEAQDAMYTVSKNGRKEQAYTSAENTVKLDFGRMDVTFHKTGEATIKAGEIDQDQIVSAVKDLVEKNNSTISLLEKNAELGYGVQRQLDAMAGSIADRHLEGVGISRGEDGRLTLDEEKLVQALEEKPEQAKELLGGSFGLGQSAFDDARQGMQQSGASLLRQNTIANNYSSYSNDYSYFSDFTNSLQMLGMYNRYGVRTMSNLFALGNYFDQYI